MKRLQLVTLAAALALSLPGCSMLMNVYRTYEEPAEAPRVRLRISLSNAGFVRVHPGRCIDHSRPGGGAAFAHSVFQSGMKSFDHIFERRDLGVQGVPWAVSLPFRDVWVPAGQPLSLTYVTDDVEAGLHQGCSVPLRVDSPSDTDLQLVAGWVSPRLRHGGCQMAVFALAPQGPQRLPAVKASDC